MLCLRHKGVQRNAFFHSSYNSRKLLISQGYGSATSILLHSIRKWCGPRSLSMKATCKNFALTGMRIMTTNKIVPRWGSSCIPVISATLYQLHVPFDITTGIYCNLRYNQNLVRYSFNLEDSLIDNSPRNRDDPAKCHGIQD